MELELLSSSLVYSGFPADAILFRAVHRYGLLLIVGGVIYFLPTIIAFNRGTRNGGAIFALNLLLGWTFIGWGIALVWALTVDE